MEILIHNRKSLVLTSVQKGQNFAWIGIIMMIIVISLLTEKEFLSLKPIIKMSTFQLSFL